MERLFLTLSGLTVVAGIFGLNASGFLLALVAPSGIILVLCVVLGLRPLAQKFLALSVCFLFLALVLNVIHAQLAANPLIRLLIIVGLLFGLILYALASVQILRRSSVHPRPLGRARARLIEPTTAADFEFQPPPARPSSSDDYHLLGGDHER